MHLTLKFLRILSNTKTNLFKYQYGIDPKMIELQQLQSSDVLGEKPVKKVSMIHQTKWLPMLL